MARLTQLKAIAKAIAVHGDKYKYDKAIYVNSLTLMTITCPIHGDFQQRAVTHLRGYGCQKCADDIRFSNLKKDNIETFIEKALLTHGLKYSYNRVEYINSVTDIIITCQLHGDFKQRPNSHLDDKGCPKCGGVFRYDTEEYIEKAKLIHGDFYDYHKFVYVNNRTKSIVICPKHGEFEQRAGLHLKGQGCPVCKSSKGELLIKKILDKHQIKNFQEYLIPGVTPKFRYDFYLPDYNLFIEFHGVQHFKPIAFFNGEEGLKQTKQRDMLKKSICRELKTPLLEFDYKHLNHMSEEQFEKTLLRRISKASVK